MRRRNVDVERLCGLELWEGAELRELADLLRMRADILAGVDRALMKMYLERGCSFGEMSRLLGVSETTVSRRIRKLTSRLLDGRYVACLRNRMRLGRAELEIARDRFIEGMSMPQIAAKRRMTVYRVRKGLRRVRMVVVEGGGVKSGAQGEDNS